MSVKSRFKNFFTRIAWLIANPWVRRVFFVIALVVSNVYAAAFLGIAVVGVWLITGFFSVFWCEHQTAGRKYLLFISPLIVFIITCVIYYLGLHISPGNIINNSNILSTWLLMFVLFFTGAVIGLVSTLIFIKQDSGKILKENSS